MAVGFHVPIPKTLQQTTLGLSIALLTGLAWLVVWFTGAPGHSLVHAGHVQAFGTWGQAATLFIAGWAVMTVAMMLPTMIPILSTLGTLASARPDRVVLLLLAGVGYLSIWIALGGLAYTGALGLHALTAAYEIPIRGAPLLLVLAGAFQFSSLKYRCLDKCRSPFTFVLGYWRGERQRWQALRLGAGHGLYCVGCCWALMLLMFAVGSGHFLWMLVLGIVMGVEKNMPWGRRLSAPLGVVLVVAGVAMWQV
jgi:predicted metal-binding membrane protein